MTTSTPTDSSAIRQVPVPGRRLAVRRFDPPAGGDGTPVLLLHGVPQTSRCWTPLAEDLARDRIVLAPDLPGLGSSEVRGPYDVRSVASSLIALLVAELDAVSAPPAAGAGTEADADEAAVEAADADDGPGARVDLVGHDWGGSLALAVAAARPDLVRRLVVISAPYRKVDLTRAWHIPLLGLVPPAAFASAGRAMVRGMFRYAWASGRAPSALVEGYADEYAAPDRVRAMAGYYRAAVRRQGGDTGGGTEGAGAGPQARAEQSLVGWGTADPPMPLPVGESVVTDLGRANDPASVRMVTLPGVGHWPLDEVPGVVVPLISEFLRRD
jgi:haloacetate dehalogenase